MINKSIPLYLGFASDNQQNTFFAIRYSCSFKFQPVYRGQRRILQKNGGGWRCNCRMVFVAEGL